MYEIVPPDYLPPDYCPLIIYFMLYALCFIIYICYMTILYIILALVAGAGATYLLFQGKMALLQSQLAQAGQDQTKLASLEAEIS